MNFEDFAGNPTLFAEYLNEEAGDYIRGEGLPMPLFIAQTGLESGWGKKRTGENNYWGIKWRGEGTYTECITKEHYPETWSPPDDRWQYLGNGVWEGPAKFQDLESIKYGTEFWVNKMKYQDEYKGIWNYKDYWTRIAMVCSVYATDRYYMEKITNIINRENLRRFD